MPADGVVSVCEEHEDSVYAVEWSCADPWIYASLSYDGRLVINRVPRATKYHILLWTLLHYLVDIVVHNPVTDMVRRDTCQCDQWMERWLAVSFCGQSDLSVRSYYLTTRLWPPLPFVVHAELTVDKTSQCGANLHNWWILPSDKCSCCQPQTMSDIVESCPLTKLASTTTFYWWYWYHWHL